MAAFSLFRGTNKAVVTSCENAKDYFYAHFGFTNIKELLRVLITRTPSKTELHIFCTDLRRGEHRTIYIHVNIQTDYFMTTFRIRITFVMIQPI